jgi:tRNA U54 and U55 pseudouridine synthase Pus10
MFPGIRFEKAYRTDTDVRYLKRGYPEIFGKAT